MQKKTVGFPLLFWLKKYAKKGTLILLHSICYLCQKYVQDLLWPCYDIFHQCIYKPCQACIVPTSDRICHYALILIIIWLYSFNFLFFSNTRESCTSLYWEEKGIRTFTTQTHKPKRVGKYLAPCAHNKSDLDKETKHLLVACRL